MTNVYESITIGVRLSAKLDATLVAMNSGVRSKLTSCVFLASLCGWNGGVVFSGGVRAFVV